MNPNEFREAIKKDGRNVDAFTVKRDYNEVVHTFQKMTPQRLNFTMGTERHGNLGGSSTHIGGWARGKLNVSAKRTELTLQRKIEKQIGHIPEDGMYFLVADVVPVGEGAKVEIYYLNSVQAAATAIKGWATGDNVGCPDPSRLF